MSDPLEAVVIIGTNVQRLVLVVFPHGGQGQARRNAWAGMVRDASLSRNQREAAVALANAHDRAQARVRRAL